MSEDLSSSLRSSASIASSPLLRSPLALASLTVRWMILACVSLELVNSPDIMRKNRSARNNWRRTYARGEGDTDTIARITHGARTCQWRIRTEVEHRPSTICVYSPAQFCTHADG
jgi:hypothetical protein